MIVLKEIQSSNSSDDFLLASLPSSIDKVPASLEGQHGCLEVPDWGFNCFLIQPRLLITECETFSFTKNTHLYGENLDTYSEDYFSQYSLEDSDFQIKGIIKETLFSKVIDCFVNSSRVKRKYKRLLN